MKTLWLVSFRPIENQKLMKISKFNKLMLDNALGHFK